MRIGRSKNPVFMPPSVYRSQSGTDEEAGPRERRRRGHVGTVVRCGGLKPWSGGGSAVEGGFPAARQVSDEGRSGCGRKEARRLPAHGGAAGRRRAQSRNPFRRPLFGSVACPFRSERRAPARERRPRAASADQPHLESPQLRQVMQPSIMTAALVLHRAQSTESGGNSPSSHPSSRRISSMWRC